MPHCVRFSLADVDVKVTKVSCFFSPVFRLCHLALISAPEGIKSNGENFCVFFGESLKPTARKLDDYDDAVSRCCSLISSGVNGHPHSPRFRSSQVEHLEQ